MPISDDHQPLMSDLKTETLNLLQTNRDRMRKNDRYPETLLHAENEGKNVLMPAVHLQLAFLKRNTSVFLFQVEDSFLSKRKREPPTKTLKLKRAIETLKMKPVKRWK